MLLVKVKNNPHHSKFKDECGSVFTDPQDILNKFNDFSVNIGPKLASNIHNTSKNYYDYLKRC